MAHIIINLLYQNNKKRFSFQSCDSQFDTVLYLYDNDFTLIAENDDSTGCDIRSILTLYSLDPSNYTLAISGFNTSLHFGPYKIHVECTPIESTTDPYADLLILNGTWMFSLDALPRPAEAMAAALYNDSIFLIGGEPPNTHQLVEYNTLTGEFYDFGQTTNYSITQTGYVGGQFYTQVNNILYSIDRREHIISIFNLESKTFIANWLTVDKYDPEESYLLDGCIVSNNEYIFIIDVYFRILNLQNLAWIKKNTIPNIVARLDATCNIYQKKILHKLYVIGGWSSGGSTDKYLSSFESLDLSTAIPYFNNTDWQEHELLIAAALHRSIVHEHSILIFGGLFSTILYTNNYMLQTQTINCLTDQVFEGGFINIPVVRAATIVVNDVVYAFGGYQNVYSRSRGITIGGFQSLDLLTLPTMQPSNAPTFSPSNAPTFPPTPSPVDCAFNEFSIADTALCFHCDSHEAYECLGEIIMIKYGYWVSGIDDDNTLISLRDIRLNDSIIAVKCPPGQCCADTNGCSYAGISDDDMRLCNKQRDTLSMACSQCNEDFYELVGGNGCGKCEETNFLYISLLFIAAFIFNIFILFIFSKPNKISLKSTEVNWRRLLIKEELSILNTLVSKITLYFYQGISQILYTKNVTPPSQFSNSLLTFANFEIAFNTIDGGICFIGQIKSGLHELLISYLFYAFLIIHFLIVAIISKFYKITLYQIFCCCLPCRKKLLSCAAHIKIGLMNIIIMSSGPILSTSFKLLTCLGVKQHIFHLFDSTKLCFGAIWWGGFAISVSLCMFWIILWYVVFKQDVNDRKHPSNQYQSLTKKFKSNVWYWEHILFIRRFGIALLTSFNYIAEDLTNISLISLTVILLSLHCLFKPFKYNRANYAEMICLFGLISITVVLNVVDITNTYVLWYITILIFVPLIIILSILLRIIWRWYKLITTKDVDFNKEEKTLQKIINRMPTKNKQEFDKQIQLTQVTNPYTDDMRYIEDKMSQLFKDKNIDHAIIKQNFESFFQSFSGSHMEVKSSEGKIILDTKNEIGEKKEMPIHHDPDLNLTMNVEESSSDSSTLSNDDPKNISTFKIDNESKIKIELEKQSDDELNDDELQIMNDILSDIEALETNDQLDTQSDQNVDFSSEIP